MNIVLPFLAILPGILICVYIYWKDTHEKEPTQYLISCFVMGMLSVIPAIALEEWGLSMGVTERSDNIFMVAAFAFGVVAFSEELVKYIILRLWAYPKSAFNEPMDGIVYAVMIGMGFATAENIMYSFSYGLDTTIIRMFTAVPAHAAFAIIMGYYVGLAKFSDNNKIYLLLSGLFLAVFMHGLYDFFLFQNNFPGLGILAIVTLILSVRYARKLIELHRSNSPFIPKEEVVDTYVNTFE